MITIPSHQIGLTQNPSPNRQNFHPSHQQALTYSRQVNRSGRTIQALQADHHKLLIVLDMPSIVASPRLLASLFSISEFLP
jgi:hypothetical protein